MLEVGVRFLRPVKSELDFLAVLVRQFRLHHYTKGCKLSTKVILKTKLLTRGSLNHRK